MTPAHRIFRAFFMACVLILSGQRVCADQIWTVSINTSQLAAVGTGPFGLDFELVGSSGNTVTLTNFSFGNGGGAGPGPAFPTGGASGDLGNSVSLSDTASFFSDFNQEFTGGNRLTFTMDSTLFGPTAGGVPDGFSMVIFEGYDPVNGYNPFTGSGGTPIPTTDPSGAQTFFNFDINGPGSTSVNSFPSASGEISITVTPVSVVPAPSSAMLLLLSIACTGTAIYRRHCGLRGSGASN